MVGSRLAVRWATAWLMASTALTAAAAETADTADVRQAVSRGLQVVQKAAARYPNHRKCFSCHHQTLPMLAMAAARDGGTAVDEKLLRAQAEFTQKTFRDRLKELEEGRGVGGRALTVGYALWALDLAGWKNDDVTRALVAYLLKTQKADGQWERQMSRPPLEDSNVTCTVLAVYGMKKFAERSQEPAVAAAAAKARVWLDRTQPATQEDRVARLWGLDVFGARPDQVRAARRAVVESQQTDGGWAQLPGMKSDAYATGQTLFVLHKAGLPPSDPAYRRGVRFLLTTQDGDGSWLVETRSKPVQVPFDNGDPHGKNQFISTPATAWAVAALAASLPASRKTTALDGR